MNGSLTNKSTMEQKGVKSDEKPTGNDPEFRKKRPFEPCQIHCGVTIWNLYYTVIVILVLTGIIAACLPFLLFREIYGGSGINQRVNFQVHGLLVIHLHITCLSLCLGATSRRRFVFLVKFFVNLYVVCFYAVALPFIAIYLRVGSIPLFVFCAVFAIETLFVCFILFLLLWRPGPPVNAEERREKKTKKSKKNA